MPWWLLARRLHVVPAVVGASVWCVALRVLGGDGVALPFGTQVAPVWIFAIVGTAVVCLPVVSTRLTLAERQSARCTPRLMTARTAAYLGVVTVCLGAFAGPDPAPSFVTVAAVTASLGLVLAAAVGDAAVVVLLAAGLVGVFCTTQPWSADALLDVDRRPAWSAVPLMILVVASAVPARVAAMPQSGIR